jgi:hypothetical protein
MDVLEMLRSALMAEDGERARSQQTQIGVSSIGGCKRKAYYILNGQEKVNFTDKLAAIMGTAIHENISKAIVREDIFGDNFLIEQEVTFGNLKGHFDLFIKEDGLVVDWKTTTKKGLVSFPSKEQIWQVQIYGWLLIQNGFDVREVSLVGIARDGSFDDLKIYRAPYNDLVALEGIEWLKKVEAMTEPPEPEKYRAFCKKYCEFYSDQTCLGL